MDKYTQLNPEMQEKWNYKMKEFEELKKEELCKMLDNEIQKEYETIWIPNVGSVEFSLAHFAEEYDNQLKELYSSTDSRILTLKSQLKHCKNYLERQNIERELNRLYKERR